MNDFPICRTLIFSLSLFIVSATLVLADDPAYETKSFTFNISDPWCYATPSFTEKKNIARCFLKSKLRFAAKGRFIVDAGGANEDMPKLLDSMALRMVPKGSTAKVARRKEKLDGLDAILLTSDTRDYYIPCAVVVCMRNERLYMAMLSIAKTEDLKHRDSMIESLLTTWKWK